MAAPARGAKLEGVKKTKWTQHALGEKLTEYGPVTQYNNFYEFGTGKTDPAENTSRFKPRP